LLKEFGSLRNNIYIPDAIVVIVTYNSESDIETCIQSLAQHFPLLNQGRAQVHIVDNASSDSTPEILSMFAKKYCWLNLHFQRENLGFGAGNNVVLKSIPSNTYVLLNADTSLVADSISPAIEYLDAHSEIGVLGLPLVYPDGSPQSYTFVASAWYRWFLLLIGLRRLAKVFASLKFMHKLIRPFPFFHNFANNHAKKTLDLNNSLAIAASFSGETRLVSWVAGAAMLLSSNFVKESRGFDPNIFLYGEDEDLCIDARRRGYSVMVLQTPPVVHNLGWSGDSGFQPCVAKMKYDSLKYFIRKNIDGDFNRFMMRILLPFYVYGRHIIKFIRPPN